MAESNTMPEKGRKRTHVIDDEDEAIVASLSDDIDSSLASQPKPGIVAHLESGVAIAPGMFMSCIAWVVDVHGKRVSSSELLKYMCLCAPMSDEEVVPLISIDVAAHPDIPDALALRFRMIRSKTPNPGSTHGILIAWKSGPIHFSECIQVKEVDPVGIVNMESIVIEENKKDTKYRYRAVEVTIRLFDHRGTPVPGAGHVVRILPYAEANNSVSVTELSRPGVYTASIPDAYSMHERLPVFFGDVKVQ